MNKTKEFECNDESVSDKIKNKGSLIAIIGTGILGLLHTLSHLIPAIGAIGYMKGYSEPEDDVINIFGYNIEPILAHPIMQIAYVGFVFLGFYYIYRDHKHHEHEKEIRKKLYETQKELEKYKNKESKRVI